MRTRPASVPHHSTRNRHSWQARLFVAAFLLLLTVVYFWRQLIEGQELYWGDIGLYFMPMEVFLHQSLAAGRLPLWNPLILCGTPYVGNPQTWPLYPVTALLPLVAPSQFINLTIALHVWLAGLGTYAFARRSLGVGTVAALLSAITFMFGGQLVSKEQFPNMVQAAAYLPWVLLSLDALLRRKRRRDALALGLVLGLQLLAAHVQMTVLTLYLAAAYGLFVRIGLRAANHAVGAAPRGRPSLTDGRPSLTDGRPSFPRRPSASRQVRREAGQAQRGVRKEEGQARKEEGQARKEEGQARGPAPTGWRTAGLLLLSGMVASGLAAGQLLPTLALFRDAARQKLAFSTVNRFYLPYNRLGDFVLPKLYGHPFYGNWSGRGNFWETCDYVGVLSFGLALWGIFVGWRLVPNRPARFWSIVFVFGTVMALGGGGGLYHLAYWILPGFKSFHDPARCLLWACFALSLLAGWGWEQVFLKSALENLPHSLRLATPPEAGRAGEITPPRLPLYLSVSGGSKLVSGWVLLLLAFADLTHFGQTLYPLTDPSALSPVSPNVAAVQADADIQAHQARILAPTNGVWLRFTAYKDFRQSVPGYQMLWADTLTPNLTMPYGLSQAGGYEPVALKTAEIVTKRAERGFDPKATAKERKDAAALAGLLGVKYIAVCQVKPPELSVPGLVSVRTSPTLAPPGHSKQAASIYLVRNTLWLSRAHLEGSAVAVPLTDDGPDKVTLTVTTLAPAHLVLADTLAAGWSATVDGDATPIQSYDGCLRSVALPTAGPHRVVFAYAPTPFRVGLYLSLLTVLLLTGTTIFALARNLGRRAGFRQDGVE